MKILFITARFPYPPVKGDRVRPYHFIKELAKNHTLDLCAFYETETELSAIDEMRKYCKRIEGVLLSPWQSYGNVLMRMMNGKPFQVNYYYSLEMKKKVKEMVADSEYDIVHIVLQRMMEYALYVPTKKIVLDQIDALSLNMKRRAVTETNLFKKTLFYLEYKNMKRYEQKQKKFAASIVTSEVDKKALENDRIHVIPNGVDAQYFSPNGEKRDIDLIFTGNMSYFPNVDSALYLCSEIVPRLKKRFPSMRLFIVGINPAPELKKLSDGKNVFVTGFVSDVRLFLNRAKVFVAPLRSGSGIQNKILEAMATGLPVVTTAYGNAAIRAKNREHLVIADGPGNFTDSVIELLMNEPLRRRLGENARLYMENEFGWSRRAKELEAVYSLVKSKG